ncbi:MAG TPA: hypothetical protein VK365_04630 [Nocardioidaceae bacterium]|jgi:hypothetical protein|nr:hypothetical protein [Nocardioidaceae bacterium]
MAGGMHRRGTSRSLAARTADRRSTDDDRIGHLRRRHCWVLGTGRDPGPWPGLVAEWRRSDDGWQARVVYAVGDTSTTTQEWLPAARLRPGSWPAMETD